MYERKIKEDLDCGIYVAMKVFGAKWKPCIIDAISRGSKRPSQIHKEMNNTSARVIDMQLAELMEYGVVCKTVHPGFPLNVEYSLTPMGEEILPILLKMSEWGDKHKEFVKEISGHTTKDKWSQQSSICLQSSSAMV